MQLELGRAHVEFERITAVDGAALGERVLQEFRHARMAATPQGWLPGEVGCFLSHFEAWRRIASGRDAWAAVFEDDLRVSPELGRLFASTDWIPDDADVIRLEANRAMRLSGGRPIRAVPGRRLYRARSGTAGAAGYVISRKACLWLIETAPHLHTSLDIFLFKPKASSVARRLKRYQVVPALCVQDGVLEGREARLKSLIKTRNTRGRAYRATSNPVLRLWPVQRIAVPYRP